MAPDLPHRESGDRTRERAAPELDWTQVRAVLRRHLHEQLPSGDRDSLEDLVQEALVRLLRVRRREPIANLDALLHTLTRRTCIDFLRRKRRWTLLIDAGGVDVTELPGPARSAPWAMGDGGERIEFVVGALFEREGHHECGSLAQEFFSERDWSVVARERNLSAAAVRKRWSRCLDTLRRAVRADPWLSNLFGDAAAAFPSSPERP